MRILYTFCIRCYWLAIRVAALFGNEKAAKMFAHKSEVYSNGDSNSKWIWVHAASLGEFEQGRPIIEELKSKHADYKILLTFFSPSGYEIRKNYELADRVAYLPPDTPRNAKRLLSAYNVRMAVFVKYEFWFNYINELNNRDIPLIYISVLLSPRHFVFKWYGGWFRKCLRGVTRFFVQDSQTKSLLESAGIGQASLCGDTRFDRVASIAANVRPIPETEKFIDGRKCFVAGSSWSADENLFRGFVNSLPDGYCAIIAPHDISETHVRQIRSAFPESVLYTELEGKHDSRIMIQNTIGLLSQTYQYASFAYVGGGFGAGLHNIQEAVAFGCPVVVGPKYKNFKEAVDLVEQGGAFAVTDGKGFESIVSRLVSDREFLEKASTVCRDYVKGQCGATRLIIDYVSAIL